MIASLWGSDRLVVRGTVPWFAKRDWKKPRTARQDSWCLSRDSNRTPSGYKSRMLSPYYSVQYHRTFDWMFNELGWFSRYSSGLRAGLQGQGILLSTVFRPGLGPIVYLKTPPSVVIESGRVWKEEYFMLLYRYTPVRTRESHKEPQDIRCPGRNSNREAPG